MTNSQDVSSSSQGTSSSPKAEKARGSSLFFAVIGVIIVVLVLFLVIRPVGSDMGGAGNSPVTTRLK